MRHEKAKARKYGMCADFSAGYIAALKGERQPAKTTRAWRNGYRKYTETIPVTFARAEKRRREMLI